MINVTEIQQAGTNQMGTAGVRQAVSTTPSSDFEDTKQGGSPCFFYSLLHSKGKSTSFDI